MLSRQGLVTIFLFKEHTYYEYLKNKPILKLEIVWRTAHAKKLGTYLSEPCTFSGHFKHFHRISENLGQSDSGFEAWAQESGPSGSSPVSTKSFIV